LRPQAGSCYVLELVGVIGRGLGALGCVSGGFGPNLAELLVLVLVSSVVLREHEGSHMFAKKDFWAARFLFIVNATQGSLTRKGNLEQPTRTRRRNGS